MQGYNVLHPMGWDAFGLPAEQYAINRSVHPADDHAHQHRSISPADSQSLGLGYDWDREVDTTDPAYYTLDAVDLPAAVQQLFDSGGNKAMPIGHLIAELQNENYVAELDGPVNPQG